MTTDDDRERARDLLFPELANELPHNLFRLHFSDKAEEQINRIAAALAAERERVVAPVRALVDNARAADRASGVANPLLTELLRHLRAVLPPQPDTTDRTGQR